MRGSIVGDGGIAQNVRQELTDLFEKAIIEESLSKSVTRYQDAIQNSKKKLDFAVAPGVWLLPSDLEINLGTKVGYNNFLQNATNDMSFGVNSVNERDEGKKDEGSSGKKNPPPVSVLPEKDGGSKTDSSLVKRKSSSLVTENHNDALARIAILVGGAGWWMFR